MRAISTIAGISFSLFAVGVSPSCAHEAVHSTQSDGIKSLGYGTNIQWSPYSTRVSFVSNGRLMIYDIASTVTKDAGPIDGREYAWTSETQIVDMRSTWDEIRQVFDVSLSYYTVDDSGLMSVDSINSRAFYAESPPKLLKSRTSVFLWGINKERAANLVAERNSPISIAQQTQDVG